MPVTFRLHLHPTVLTFRPTALPTVDRHRYLRPSAQPHSAVAPSNRLARSGWRPRHHPKAADSGRIVYPTEHNVPVPGESRPGRRAELGHPVLGDTDGPVNHPQGRTDVRVRSPRFDDR